MADDALPRHNRVFRTRFQWLRGPLMRGDIARSARPVVHASLLITCKRRPCAPATPAAACPPLLRGTFWGQPLRPASAVRRQPCRKRRRHPDSLVQWRHCVSFAAMAPRATRAGALPVVSPTRGGRSAAASPPDERLASLRKEMVRARACVDPASAA